MAYKSFFIFASGLSAPLSVPIGTFKSITDHVGWVESELDMKVPGGGSKWHWFNVRDAVERADAEKVCAVAKEHNEFVRRLYMNFGIWSSAPVENGEQLTPEQAQTFWEAIETFIEVPTEKWTERHYRERMDHLYEVMRGRESEGVTFDENALTERQAAQVVNLFSTFLDSHDLRLDVPNGRDYLASSSDGGYEWCEKCGPMDSDDVPDCCKRGCPLIREGNYILYFPAEICYI